MPEIVTYNPSADFIYVDSFGEVSLEQVQNSISEVAKFSKKYNCKNLIIDVRKQKIALPLVDTFKISKDIISELPEYLKIAYIVNNPSKRSQSFFTRLSKNLNQALEVFYSIENAMDWFKGKYDPSSNPFVGLVKFPSTNK